MNSRTFRFMCTLATVAGLVLLPVATSSTFIARAGGEGTSEKAPEVKAPDLAPERVGDEPNSPAPEPQRIQGKIYKVDPTAKVVGVLVAQGRAYKRYKLTLDEKSGILIAGQLSNIEALENGQEVTVSYFKKGKQQFIDTLVVE